MLFHLFSGKIHYTEIFDLLRNIDPPLGFGKKCPERQAYKKLIRMNMPMDKEGKVRFLSKFVFFDRILPKMTFHLQIQVNCLDNFISIGRNLNFRV